MGLAPNDIAPLIAAVATWSTAYPAHTTATASATAATTNKDQARTAIESLTRPLIQQLQASPKVTNAQRNTMKITVRATTRTRASVPQTAPMATVDTSRRFAAHH
jgi:ribosomal protein RSM22 (predicted rRNA methylase)